MQNAFCIILILLFLAILCYPSQDCSSDAYSPLESSPILKLDVPPEHDMVADACKSYYLSPKDVENCINSNCRRLCNGRQECFDSCSLWKLIRGE